MQPLTPEAIERLQKLGGPAFVRKMIDLFLQFAGEKVAEAVAAAGAGDFETAGKAAHAIKSSAANVGAARVAQIAARIEEAARAGQGESVPAMVEELQAAFAEVTPCLEAEREACASPGDSKG